MTWLEIAGLAAFACTAGAWAVVDVRRRRRARRALQRAAATARITKAPGAHKRR